MFVLLVATQLVLPLASCCSISKGRMDPVNVFCSICETGKDAVHVPAALPFTRSYQTIKDMSHEIDEQAFKRMLRMLYEN